MSKKRWRVDYGPLFEYLAESTEPISTTEAVMKVPVFRDSLSPQVLKPVYSTYRRSMKKLGYKDDEIMPYEIMRLLMLRGFAERTRKVLKNHEMYNYKKYETFREGVWSAEVARDDDLLALKYSVEQVKRKVELLVRRGKLTEAQAKAFVNIISNAFDFAKEAALARLEELDREVKRRAAEAAALSA